MFDLAFAMNHNRVIVDLDGDIFVGQTRKFRRRNVIAVLIRNFDGRDPWGTDCTA